MSETRKIEHVLCNCECRHAQTAHEAMRELRDLTAGRDRLREALEHIEAVATLEPKHGGRKIRNAARAALSPTEQA